MWLRKSAQNWSVTEKCLSHVVDLLLIVSDKKRKWLDLRCQRWVCKTRDISGFSQRNKPTDKMMCGALWLKFSSEVRNVSPLAAHTSWIRPLDLIQLTAEVPGSWFLYPGDVVVGLWSAGSGYISSFIESLLCGFRSPICIHGCTALQLENIHQRMRNMTNVYEMYVSSWCSEDFLCKLCIWLRLERHTSLVCEIKSEFPALFCNPFTRMSYVTD